MTHINIFKDEQFFGSPMNFLKEEKQKLIDAGFTVSNTAILYIQNETLIKTIKMDNLNTIDGTYYVKRMLSKSEGNTIVTLLINHKDQNYGYMIDLTIS